MTSHRPPSDPEVKRNRFLRQIVPIGEVDDGSLADAQILDRPPHFRSGVSDLVFVPDERCGLPGTTAGGRASEIGRLVRHGPVEVGPPVVNVAPGPGSHHPGKRRRRPRPGRPRSRRARWRNGSTRRRAVDRSRCCLHAPPRSHVRPSRLRHHATRAGLTPNLADPRAVDLAERCLLPRVFDLSRGRGKDRRGWRRMEGWRRRVKRRLRRRGWPTPGRGTPTPTEPVVPAGSPASFPA